MSIGGAAMANEVPDLAGDDIREQAAQHTHAANPLVGVRGQEALGAAQMLVARA